MGSGAGATSVGTGAAAAWAASAAEATKDVLASLKGVLHRLVIEIETSLAKWAAAAAAAPEVGEVRIGEFREVAAVRIAHACRELDEPVFDLRSVHAAPPEGETFEVLLARFEGVPQRLLVDIAKCSRAAPAELEGSIGVEARILEIFDAVVTHTLGKGQDGLLTRRLGGDVRVLADAAVAWLINGGNTIAPGASTGGENNSERYNGYQRSVHRDSSSGERSHSTKRRYGINESRLRKP